MMKNIAYLTKEGNMEFHQIMRLPYGVFLSYLKQFRLMEIESTPRGREELERAKRLTNTQPDIDRLKQMGMKTKVIEK